MNPFGDTEKRRIEITAVTGVLEEIVDVASKIVFNASCGRLYEMQEEVDYIRILLHNAETNLDLMIMQKEAEDEIH